MKNKRFLSLLGRHINNICLLIYERNEKNIEKCFNDPYFKESYFFYRDNFHLFKTTYDGFDSFINTEVPMFAHQNLLDNKENDFEILRDINLKCLLFYNKFLKISSLETLEIAGRGLIKVVKYNPNIFMLNIGDYVEVDFEYYRLRGIEMSNTTHRRKTNIGLQLTKIQI